MVNHYTSYHGGNVPEKDVKKEVINTIIKNLSNRKNDFDAIAFRGISGAIIAPIIAYKLNKDLIAVRKSEEPSHSYKIVDGVLCPRYIIIDDFISIGNTVNEIIKEIKNAYNKLNQDEKQKLENCPELVGVYLYYNTYQIDLDSCKNKLKDINIHPKWIMSNDSEITF